MLSIESLNTLKTLLLIIYTMKVNAKTVYKFAKFTKPCSRPILEKIRISKTEMVATDNFKLLRIKGDYELESPQLLDTVEFYDTFKNKDKNVDVETIEDEKGEVYPKYESIMNKDDNDVEICFSAKLLIEVLEQFKGSNGSQVVIKINSKENNKIFIEGNEIDTQNIDSVIMPTEKNKL